MSNRKYRLVKDLPDYKAGEIFSWHEKSHCYAAQNADKMGQVGKWPAVFVEDNPEWFEEVKEPEAPPRIEIKKFKEYSIGGGNYHFQTTLPIPKEKFPEIKRAIEAVVNGDGEVRVPTAYNVTTKQKGCVIQDPVIERTAKGGFMIIGHDGNGTKLASLLSEEYANDLVRAGKAKMSEPKLVFQKTTPKSYDGLRFGHTNDEASMWPDPPKFQWTDELIIEFVHYTMNISPAMQGRYADIQEFKKMKSGEQSKPGPVGPSLEALEFAQKILDSIYNGTLKLEAPPGVIKCSFHDEKNRIDAAIQNLKK